MDNNTELLPTLGVALQSRITAAMHAVFTGSYQLHARDKRSTQQEAEKLRKSDESGIVLFSLTARDDNGVVMATNEVSSHLPIKAYTWSLLEKHTVHSVDSIWSVFSKP